MLLPFIFGCTSKGQETDPALTKRKVIYSDAQQDGLRGKVKSVRMEFELLSDSLLEIYNQRSAYGARGFLADKAEKNDVSLRLFSFGPRDSGSEGVLYYQEFDTAGCLIKRYGRPLDSLNQPIDSIGYSSFRYSNGDIQSKSVEVWADSTPFPAMSGLAVLPDRYYPFGKYKRFEIYRYEISDDLIRACSYYTETDTFDINLADFEPDSARLKYRASYEYDESKRLKAIDYKYMEERSMWREPTYFLVAGVRRPNDTRVEFTYNEAGRPAMVRILDSEEAFLYQETYSYEGDEIAETERLGFKNARRQAMDFHKSILTHDSFGNITKADYYDLAFGENVVWTNRYAYTYDDRDNWITCTLYTDNNPDNASGVLTRAIEYRE